MLREATMSSTSRGELLASLISISKRMQARTESGFDKLRATTNLKPSAPPESIRLPKPPPLLAPLLEAGAPQYLAKELHAFYLECAKQLKTRYTTVFSRLRSELARLSTDGIDTLNDRLAPLFVHLYTKSLQDWVRYEIEMFRVQRLSVHKKQFNQTFNHDYLPLLENSFNEDPFPTHADKVALARKSGMSYQQIHVWFQNRRSRSRRVGKVLRKKPMFEDTALQLCANRCVTRPGETVVGLSCCIEPKKLDLLGQSFDHCAAIGLRHSAQIRLKLDLDWWPRRSSSAKPRRSSFDMDGLVEGLSQLSVRDRTSGRGKRRQDGLHYQPAATSSITVVPLRAPHPALVQRKEALLSPLPPLVVRRTSASQSTRLRAFNPLNTSPPSSLPASSVVLHCPEPPHKRRKVIPNNPPLHEIPSLCKVRSRLDFSRASHVALHSIPNMSTNMTPNHILQKNHDIPPWDFRPEVAV
ncbi:hypothetical protein F5141DRAFT_1073820 [Pisolithus sp. B1]|nr:hypothetical protein F5141DRAFT_1073820 [Pisolithus sp. B1]